MKAFTLTLALILLGNGFGPLAHAQVGPLEPDFGNVEQLRTEYAHRRAEALRPLNAWYKAQLVALEQKLEKERRAVLEAKARAADDTWQDDQPELKAAVLAKGWRWRSERDEDGVEVTFLPDGTVHHVGLNGRWRITGPSEVTVEPDDTDKYVLRFDSALRSFVGSRQQVTGERK